MSKYILPLICLLSLFSCDTGQDTDSIKESVIVGEWLDYDFYYKFSDVTVFSSDGTGKAYDNYDMGVVNQEFNWSQSGSTVTLDYNNNSYDFAIEEINDNHIRMISSASGTTSAKDIYRRGSVSHKFDMAQSLSVGVDKELNLQKKEIICFSATVASGSKYSVTWDDILGSGNYTSEVMVSAFSTADNDYFGEVESGYNVPQSFTALTDTLYILVDAAYNGGTCKLRLSSIP